MSGSDFAAEDEVRPDPREGVRRGLGQRRRAHLSRQVNTVGALNGSHCECNVGWLEPLLERIYINRTIVVTPVIDNIDHVNEYRARLILQDTFEYSGSPQVYTRGIFTWSLTFSWLE